ncbi:peptidoglycan DD-metalloendopeptidase family protein [Candidatus Nomurabacteria bacterium]|nr:peptidoglycan DD-metalloendopeptidase family protein [Candidatus Nomurabacteria bacterium]
MRKIISMVVFLLVVTSISIPQPTEAQYRRSSNSQDWSQFWNSDEGSDFDYEEVRRWREENSRVRDAIDDLDNDPVDDLYIPILFGVSLSDLYPNFGDPRDSGAREHEGLDIMATDGTPIVSPTDAVVVRVGDGSGSGLYVSTANPGGETFVYMHLSEVADIDGGDVLEAGDLIGYVGNTGNASGGAAHLHFEIRENRDPYDPIKRLTKEFSLKDKMKFVQKMLDDIDDADELAEFLASEYQNVFVSAGAQDIDVPEMITDELPLTARTTITTGLPARDLQLGSFGPDVVALQSRLIADGYLDLSTPTDQFGPLTQAALIRYQLAKGISPASGYYGPLTRASMGASNVISAPVATTMTREQLIKEIERLLKLIAERSQ